MDMDPGADIVVVRAFLYPIEAHLALSAIVAAGIEARLADEHIISMDWTYATAVGWVKVRVRATDLAAATEVLDEKAVVVRDGDEGAAVPNLDVVEPCDNCGATAVVSEVRGIRAFWWTFLIVGVPLWWTRRRWRCRNCGHLGIPSGA
jgi:hypothetical protein